MDFCCFQCSRAYVENTQRHSYVNCDHGVCSFCLNRLRSPYIICAQCTDAGRYGRFETANTLIKRVTPQQPLGSILEQVQRLILAKELYASVKAPICILSLAHHVGQYSIEFFEKIADGFHLPFDPVVRVRFMSLGVHILKSSSHANVEDARSVFAKVALKTLQNIDDKDAFIDYQDPYGVKLSQINGPASLACMSTLLIYEIFRERADILCADLEMTRNGRFLVAIGSTRFAMYQRENVQEKQEVLKIWRFYLGPLKGNGLERLILQLVERSMDWMKIRYMETKHLVAAYAVRALIMIHKGSPSVTKAIQDYATPSMRKMVPILIGCQQIDMLCTLVAINVDIVKDHVEALVDMVVERNAYDKKVDAMMGQLSAFRRADARPKPEPK